MHTHTRERVHARGRDRGCDHKKRGGSSWRCSRAPAWGSVLARHPCAPRHAASPGARGALLHVACAGGEPVSLTADGAVARSRVIAPDLRDVVVLAQGGARLAASRGGCVPVALRRHAHAHRAPCRAGHRHVVAPRYHGRVAHGEQRYVASGRARGRCGALALRRPGRARGPGDGLAMRRTQQVSVSALPEVDDRGPTRRRSRSSRRSRVMWSPSRSIETTASSSRCARLTSSCCSPRIGRRAPSRSVVATTTWAATPFSATTSATRGATLST